MISHICLFLQDFRGPLAGNWANAVGRRRVAISANNEARAREAFSGRLLQEVFAHPTSIAEDMALLKETKDRIAAIKAQTNSMDSDRDDKSVESDDDGKGVHDKASGAVPFKHEERDKAETLACAIRYRLNKKIVLMEMAGALKFLPAPLPYEGWTDELIKALETKNKG